MVSVENGPFNASGGHDRQHRVRLHPVDTCVLCGVSDAPFLPVLNRLVCAPAPLCQGFMHGSKCRCGVRSITFGWSDWCGRFVLSAQRPHLATRFCRSFMDGRVSKRKSKFKMRVLAPFVQRCHIHIVPLPQTYGLGR